MQEVSTEAFLKAKDNLWKSLQKHLVTIYAAEDSFFKCLTFADAYPFEAAIVDKDSLSIYWEERTQLRNLFIDETMQLATLVKAIRLKNYEDSAKKQLYMILLGYFTIVENIKDTLNIYSPTKVTLDTEFDNAASNFDRMRNFIKLNIKGLKY